MTSDTQNADISGKSTISEVSGKVEAGMNVDRLADTFQISSEITDDGMNVARQANTFHISSESTNDGMNVARQANTFQISSESTDDGMNVARQANTFQISSESTDDGMNVARQANTFHISSESTDADLDDVTDSRSDIQVEYSQDNDARLEERIEKTLDVGADTETRGSMGAEGVNRGPLLSDSQGSTVKGSKSESEAIVDTQEGTTEADSMTNFESKINTGIDKVSTLYQLEQEFNNPFARSLGPPKPSNSQEIKLGSFSFGRFSII